MTRRTHTALVTGASSGIGAAFTEVLARRGFNLVITARRERPLRELAERLTRQYRIDVDVVTCDLAQADAAKQLCAALDERGLQIDALVHSAGFGLPGTYESQPWHTHNDMLQLMVVAPAELTHRLLPGMLERGYGRIVTVASLAGLVPAGAGTMYSAAKAFAVSFSISLAREVAPRGVYVTALCPGLTRTGFHDDPALQHTVHRVPAWMWMDPRAVAESGVRAVMTARPVHVPGAVNRIFVLLLRYAPRWSIRAAAAGLRVLKGHFKRTAVGEPEKLSTQPTRSS